MAVDRVAGATGSTSVSDSGPLQTTNANDLLVAANMVYTASVAPGTGFTQRIVTTPDGDSVEDRVVSALAPTTRRSRCRARDPGSCRRWRSARRRSGAPTPRRRR